MKTTYQILSKGTYSNKLRLYETNDYEDFNFELNKFKKGEYPYLILIETNISRY